MTNRDSGAAAAFPAQSPSTFQHDPNGSLSCCSPQGHVPAEGAALQSSGRSAHSPLPAQPRLKVTEPSLSSASGCPGPPRVPGDRGGSWNPGLRSGGTAWRLEFYRSKMVCTLFSYQSGSSYKSTGPNRGVSTARTPTLTHEHGPPKPRNTAAPKDKQNSTLPRWKRSQWRWTLTARFIF